MTAKAKFDFDISSSIDTAKELLLSKPQSSATSDVKKSKESKLVSYEIRFPDFYFSSVENGWLCKICCSFSHGNAGNRAFVEKPKKLGEHPSARFSDHLNSNRHKLSVKNKQCFKEMSNRNANVWQLAFNASLQSGETKRQNNRFILKCFFKITFLMIRKNWAHSHNFRDIVELVADCGAKEISSHLLTAPKNAKYLSPLYVSKYIETMSNYIKQPLLENTHSNLYSFYTDETSDETCNICNIFRKSICFRAFHQPNPHK